EPLQEAVEDRRRSLGERSGILVQLRAEGPHGAAALRDHVAALERRLNERYDPFTRLVLRVPRRADGDVLRRLLLDERLADRVLRLEVIVEVAEGNPRLVRNVGER